MPVELDFFALPPDLKAKFRELERQGLVRLDDPVKPPERGVICVYLFAVIRAGPVKIGISEDVRARLRHLITASGRRLKCFGAMPVLSREVARKIEREVHTLFAKRRLPGEWFKVPVSHAVRAIDAARTGIMANVVPLKPTGT